MYKSFTIFSVADERALRDPVRIRALGRARHAGTLAGVIMLATGGLGCLALGAGGVYLKLTAASPQPKEAWTMMGIGFGFGAMMLLMAAAFYRERALCPLAGYLRSPQRYDFVKGRLVEATYISDGSRSSRKMLVRGSYGDKGLFIEEFDPDAWSDAVAERGEENLKPGDDRYDQKGRRVRLPIDVWVLCGIDGKGPAALAGIPAETVSLLNRGKK